MARLYIRLVYELRSIYGSDRLSLQWEQAIKSCNKLTRRWYYELKTKNKGIGKKRL